MNYNVNIRLCLVCRVRCDPCGGLEPTGGESLSWGGVVLRNTDSWLRCEQTPEMKGNVR